MKTWISILEESLSSAYTIEWETQGHREVASFTTDGGKPAEVFFARRKSDNGKCEIIFQVGYRETVTGKGDSFKVFSTVLEAIHQFMKRHPETTTFFFSGKEPSRMKLYRALVNRFAKDFRVEERNNTFYLYR